MWSCEWDWKDMPPRCISSTWAHVMNPGRPMFAVLMKNSARAPACARSGNATS
jgi:hypothetical protein